MIRPPEEFLKQTGIPGIEDSHSMAERELIRPILLLVFLLELFFKPGYKDVSCFCIRRDRQNSEFIPADSRFHIGFAKGGPDRTGSTDKRFITFAVSVRIVDLLEVIDIKKKEDGTFTLPSGKEKLLFDYNREAAAVVKACEGVRNSSLSDPFFLVVSYNRMLENPGKPALGDFAFGKVFLGSFRDRFKTCC